MGDKEKQEVSKEDVGSLEDVLGKKPLETAKPYVDPDADSEATTVPFKEPVKDNQNTAPYKAVDKVADKALELAWVAYVATAKALGWRMLFDDSFLEHIADMFDEKYDIVSVTQKDDNYVLVIKTPSGAEVTIVG